MFISKYIYLLYTINIYLYTVSAQKFQQIFENIGPILSLSRKIMV